MTGCSSLFDARLAEYQAQARKLLIDYESELPVEVAGFLDDIAVIHDEAHRDE